MHHNSGAPADSSSPWGTTRDKKRVLQPPTTHDKIQIPKDMEIDGFGECVQWCCSGCRNLLLGHRCLEREEVARLEMEVLTLLRCSGEGWMGVQSEWLQWSWGDSLTYMQDQFPAFQRCHMGGRIFGRRWGSLRVISKCTIFFLWLVQACTSLYKS
jgi:hypothetical protein